ncbi:MAG: Fe2+-dependent dioxygenase [Thiolinea sp.]
MLIHIKGVLDERRLAEVQSLLAQAEFVDGRLSAGREAGQVKHNEELSANSPLRRRLDALVMSALVQHPQYQTAALPLKVATAFYARYQPGMTYGFHVDDPVMGPMQGRYRSDVSTTVFLNAADDYDGGELVIRTPFGEQCIKGEAGDAVVYPSGSWHKVAEVTRGTRLVAVTWAQSLVKSPEQRELLYQLAQAREGLLQSQPQSPETANVSTVYANLVRMWSEV